MDENKGTTGVTASRAPILPTKLFVPLLKPDLIPRERLVDRLASARGAALILVSASAGSGKTTMVADFVRRAGAPTAWLTLDPSDDEPAAFLGYLVEAFDVLAPGVGARARALLGTSPPPEPRLIAHALLADVAGTPTAGCVVIDDYHVVSDPAIHDLVSLLVERTPAEVMLVVITRSDPPLPLARLRVRGQLCEVREADLRFGSGEAAELMARYSERPIRPASVETLVRRTEGWAAGLQLAGLALRNVEDPDAFVTSFHGTHTFVADYLTDEVLATIPGELQRFVLRSSVLDRFSSGLCDAALGTTNSQTVLEELLRMNLFLVPLDGERRWFRYHHLFTDLLRRRSEDEDEAETRAVLARASAWCEDHGAPDDAIRYAVRAGDVGRAAVLVARHGIEALAAGAAYRALHWIHLLPADVVESSPDHCAIAVWARTLTEEYDVAAPFCRRAVERLAVGDRPYPYVDDVELHVRMLRAGLEAMDGRAIGEVIDELSAVAREASGNNPIVQASGELMVGNLCWVAGRYADGVAANERAMAMAITVGSVIRLAAVTGLAGMHLARGDLARAIRMAEEELEGRRAPEEILGVQVANLSAILALAQLERGEVGQAAAALARARTALGHPEERGPGWPPADRRGGVRHVAFHSSAPVINLGLAAYLELLLQTGERDSLVAYLSALEAVAHSQGSAVSILLESVRVTLLCADGERTRLQRWPRREEEDSSVCAFWRHASALTRARVALGAGDPGTAQAELEALMPRLEEQEAGFHLAEARVLHALACSALGMRDTAARDTAARSADAALEQTGASERVGPWLRAGEPAVALLEGALARGTASPTALGHATGLLALLRDQDRDRAGAETAGLSGRELAVLRLMAAGRSNKQIARALSLAVGTVKKHTHNIFTKLGASNRTQAVETARTRGLLTESPKVPSE